MVRTGRYSPGEAFPRRLAQIYDLLAPQPQHTRDIVIIERKAVPKPSEFLGRHLQDLGDLTNTRDSDDGQEHERGTTLIVAKNQQKSDPLSHGQLTDFLPDCLDPVSTFQLGVDAWSPADQQVGVAIMLIVDSHPSPNLFDGAV